jgi:hypothetical protein
MQRGPKDLSKNMYRERMEELVDNDISTRYKDPSHTWPFDKWHRERDEEDPHQRRAEKADETVKTNACTLKFTEGTYKRQSRRREESASANVQN